MTRDEIIDRLDELADAHLSGDETAFTEIYEISYKLIAQYIKWKMMGQLNDKKALNEDIEEIANDTYHKLYNNIHKWDRKIPLIALLYLIAAHFVIDWLRVNRPVVIYKGTGGKRKQPVTFIDKGDGTDKDPYLALPDSTALLEKAVECKELREELYKDMAQGLGAKQNEILTRILDGEEPAKIAESMGIKVDTVYSQYSRAKAIMKKFERKYTTLYSMAGLGMFDIDVISLPVPAMKPLAISTAATTTTTTAATATAATATTTTAATAAASQTTIGGLGIMANVIGTKIGVAVITAAVAAAGVGVPMYITAEHRQAEQAAVIEQEQQARQGLETRLAEIEQKLSTEQAARQEIETKLTQTAEAYEAAQTEAQEMTAKIETLQAVNETMQKQIDAEKAAQAEPQVLGATNIPQQAQQPPTQQQSPPQQSSGAASAGQAGSSTANQQQQKPVGGGMTGGQPPAGPAQVF